MCGKPAKGNWCEGKIITAEIRLFTCALQIDDERQMNLVLLEFLVHCMGE